MHQHYEPRIRAGRRARILRLVLALLCAVALATVLIFVLRWGKVPRPIAEEDGIKQVSTVEGTRLAVYDGTGWEPRFWNGVNMGASLPGHSPGELAPTREDYLRWFGEMKQMNVDVVRVYTILNPDFYDALDDFNSTREDPLWLIHGVWSPEEELIGPDQKGRDAYDPKTTATFKQELRDAAHVVHGDADLPERPGHASGRFRSDVSEYMLGWMIGTEWFPYAVKVTDDSNPDVAPYEGEYFRGTEEASPFESWLAMMLDTLAKEDMKYGWQHPASFTNWLTTDPLSHPNEANEQEDLVSVDPMHVEPTAAWKAGYYAQYHVYPYYPDFLRYEPEYQTYRNPEGEIDPYAGYLHELRLHHKGIPLLVGEFGVPSSRGMAHRGPLGRDQGYHTEEEQGEINADLLEQIRNEGFDGGLLFAWTDEWFKFTWNTTDLEIPKDRRQMWHNRLTNEENFGVIASEAGDSEQDTIHVDGETDDWKRRSGETGFFDRVASRILGNPHDVERKRYDGFDLSVSHDETYIYLLMDKRRGDWNFEEDEVDVGFGTLGGGSTSAKPAPGLSFPDGGIQFLLQLKGAQDSRMLVNSAYDQHTWLWGYRYHYIPDKASHDASAGEFLPWNLALSREIFLPQTKRRIPFQEIEVGKMREGVGDPASPDFDSLSDWYAKGDVLEVRIPWMLLGFTDPSSLRVWDYPYETSAHQDKLEAKGVDGLRVYPAVRGPDTASHTIDPLTYSWDGWDQPDFHERKKKGFDTLRKAYEDKRLRQP